MTSIHLKTDFQQLRIAILNPWFLVGGGGSKVVSVFASLFPDADIFTLFYKRDKVPESIRTERLHASFLQRVPFIDRLYRPLLPIHPLAVETLDMRGYQIVISCDASVMKGVLVDQGALHICYCHTPTRYAWDLHRTFAEQTSILTKPIFWLTSHYLRQWDFAAAQRVDHFIANSKYIAQRIHTYYRRESTVIYPPVNTAAGYIADSRDDYYLTVGRLTHTKRVDLLIRACNQLGRRLLVVGTGREEPHLRSLAGPTIEFAGRLPDATLAAIYANCRALLFAADEDFGIVPVEAQSFGRPVVAYGRGGVLETVIAGDRSDVTGVLFPEQSVASLMNGIQEFEAIEHRFDPVLIRAHAQRFGIAVFSAAIKEYLHNAYTRQQQEDYCR